MKKIFFVVLTFIFAFSNIVEAKDDVSLKSRYKYFTQDKNITNLSTQLPAQKGLLEKRESDEIKSIGNYQEKVGAPRTHLDVDVEINLNKSIIALNYCAKPNKENMSSRVPMSQQLFQEAISETHIYLIFPKSLNLINELQIVRVINNITKKETYFAACSPENTKLSEFLKKCNAFTEGTYKLTRDERTQLERMVDNLLDATGKYGKAAKWIKTGIKWGMERQEKQRIEKLQEKYGNDYIIYKVPFYVPEGISMTYSHIGRTSRFFFDTSKLKNPEKIFIEIPRISFEVNVPGSIRRASLEGLAYEVGVEPTGKTVDTSSDSSKATIKESPKNLCQEISQEEANSIDKTTLRKMFLECGSISLLKTIIRTKKFSDKELCIMAEQSKKWPFDRFNALYMCDIVSWEEFGRMWDAYKRKNR